MGCVIGVRLISVKAVSVRRNASMRINETVFFFLYVESISIFRLEQTKKNSSKCWWKHQSSHRSVRLKESMINYFDLEAFINWHIRSARNRKSMAVVRRINVSCSFAWNILIRQLNLCKEIPKNVTKYTNYLLSLNIISFECAIKAKQQKQREPSIN